MKIIDLLNKIANGEEVPEKIKFDNKEYENEPCYMLYEATGDRSELQFKKFLNDEVEILEEEKKIPEKLFFTHISNYNDQSVVNNNFNNYFKKTQETINQLIDYLKSKGDE